VHDALGVHVLERGAELRKVLPNGALGDEALLLLEVLDHAGEVPGVSQLKHDVQLVVLHEGGQVFDHVRVVKLLQKNKQQLNFIFSSLNLGLKILLFLSDICTVALQRNSNTFLEHRDKKESNKIFMKKLKYTLPDINGHEGISRGGK
jgi:hypothetical protein